MIDGLRQENYLGGSVFSDLVSGQTVQIGTLTATNIKSGSSTLALGSVVITFGTAFPNANYHVVFAGLNPASPNAAPIISAGSLAAGSFMAIGSLLAATDLFSWVAIPRSS